MTLLGLVRLILEMLARGIHFTARNPGTHFILIFMCVVRFIFNCGNSLQTKGRHTVKNWFQHCGSLIRKEKSKPNFNILKSVFFDGMSYRFSECTNPVMYFCSEISRSRDKGIRETESSSDEVSSHGGSIESVEIETEIDETEFEEFEDSSDSPITGISSTETVFVPVSAEHITQKRKAESDTSESSKRSKSTDSLESGDASKQSDKITAVNTESSSEASSYHSSKGISSGASSVHSSKGISSETSSSHSNEGTSSVSDLQLTDVLCPHFESDQMHELPEIENERLSVEKYKSSKLPSQASPSTDKELLGESLDWNNAKDKRTPFEREGVSSCDSELKCTVSVCPHKVPKSTQNETTKKSYPNQKMKCKNLLQYKSYDIPSDPRIRKKKMLQSELHLEPSRRIHEEKFFKDDTLTKQNITLSSESETTDANKNPERSEERSKNVLKCPFIFPEINLSSLVIEQSQQKNLVLHNYDVSKEISEIVREFFKNYKHEKFVQSSNFSLELPQFSCELEKKAENSDLKSKSEVSELPSEIQPCSSTHESGFIPIKSYPGLSLQPLKVKKDARYQKKFYKQRKDITLPKKLGEVIQWVARKPRNEVDISVPEIQSSDEKDLPIDKYHEQAQSLASNFMRMFDTAKEQKARKKLAKKNRKEQKERMRPENTGYVESSFKEESPSSESSDSLPTSGDSPVKSTNPLVSRPKISSDFDISLVQVSPLKPVATVMPSLSSQQKSLCEPLAVNVRHLSDDENIIKDSTLLDSVNLNDILIHSAWNKFFDYKETVSNPENNFFRDLSWKKALFVDSGQCVSQNRLETKSGSSICEKSNLTSVEQQNLMQETQTTLDVSSVQQDLSGHGITPEEVSVDNEMSSPSCAMGKSNESNKQTYDTACKVRSTPEKNILPTREILESDPASSDPTTSDSVTSDNLTSVTSDSETSDS